MSEAAAAVLRDLLERADRTEGSLTPEVALRSLVAVVATAADASSALLAVRDRESPTRLRDVVRTGRYETAPRGPVSAGEGIAGAAIRGDRAILCPDLSTDHEASDAERATRIGPLCARPLHAGGRAVGVLCLARDRGADPFTEVDLDTVAAYDVIASEMLAALPGLDAQADDRAPGRDRELMNSLRHAVNNPLAVIMGQAQILVRDPTVAEDPYLLQSMEAVLEAAERIRTVLRGLTAEDERAG